MPGDSPGNIMRELLFRLEALERDLASKRDDLPAVSYERDCVVSALRRINDAIDDISDACNRADARRVRA